jgi:hypothetical protein
LHYGYGREVRKERGGGIHKGHAWQENGRQMGGRVGCGGWREFASGSEWRLMEGNGNALHVAGTAPRAIAQPAHGDGVGSCGELRIEREVNGISKGIIRDPRECAPAHGNAVGTGEK